MIETDISKVLIEGDYATIMGVKYKRVEEPKPPVEEAYKDWWGQYPELETDSKYDDIRWQGFQAGYELAQPKAVPVEEPTKPMDEVVDRLIKKHQAQKLWNRLFEVGYDREDCNMILSIVEDWLPEPQSAAGSQNVNTELLVDGFNHCLEKIKGMLR